MHFIKKLVRGLAVATLGLFLVVLAGAISWRLTFANKNKVEGWLTKSGFYERAPGTLTANLAKNDSPDSNLRLNDPKIKQIFEAALTPSFLKQSTENLINGLYDWLDGKAAKPDFRIDFTPVKDQLVINLATYAKQRAHSLPACNPRALPPADTNPLDLTCLPPKINIDASIDTWAQNLFNSSNGDLPNLVITADSLASKDASSNKSSPFDNKTAPRLFDAMKKSLPIFLLLAVLSIGLILWLYEDKALGLRKIVRSFLSVGSLLLISALVTKLLITHFANKPGAKPDDAFANLGLPLIKTASASVVMSELWVAAAYLLIAALGYLGLKKMPKTAAK